MLELCVELDQRMPAELLINSLKAFSPDFGLKGSDDAIDGFEPSVYFLILASALGWAPGLYEHGHLLEYLTGPSLKQSYLLSSLELSESLLKKMYEIYRIFY